MPKKHSLSHGLATLFSIIGAGLLVGVLKRHIPFYVGLLDSAGSGLSNALASAGLELSPELMATALFASIMAGVWGLAFAYLRRERQG